MYSPRQVLKGIRNPDALLREIQDLRRGAYLRWYQQWREVQPLDLMAAEWDTLVVLDACRYDLFENVHTLAGELEKVVSKGTGTDEFVHENFDGRDFADTVYLTANPHLHFVDAGFRDIVPLWRTEWDEKLDTVRPEVVTERALEVHDQYPNKRVIVHYIQPHYPFIGPAGRQLEESGGYRGFLERGQSVFHALEAGEIGRESLWEAYRENLELALPAVERLCETVDGLCVITSDHGNAFGEWGVYGHGGPKIPSLVEVPWLIGEFEERRDIVAGRINSRTDDLSAAERNGTIEHRLESLGYL